MAESDLPIRAVAFDLDGLMFNTEELYIRVAKEMLERRGHTLDMDLIHSMMGRPARDAFPIMIDHYGLTESIEQLEDETRAIFDDILPNSLATMPGLLPLLNLIDAKQVPKCIATSSSLPYLQKILELGQLPTQFVFQLTSENVVQGKPNPEIYLTAAAKFGVSTAEMLVFEDSEHGCRAAVAAGAVTVAVPAAHNRVESYPDVFLMAESLADSRIVERLS